MLEYRTIENQPYGVVLEFAPMVEHSSEAGFIEYGHIRNTNGGDAYAVLVDGHLVFEAFTSSVVWEKFNQLLPE